MLYSPLHIQLPQSMVQVIDAVHFQIKFYVQRSACPHTIPLYIVIIGTMTFILLVVDY